MLNNVPSKSVVSTPYEMLTGHKSSVSHLRVWGYLTYVKHLDSDKLGPRSNRCLFIGYPKKTKGYLFYLGDEQKVFIALRAIFLEKKFLREGTIASKIKLDEVQLVEEPTHSKDIIELAMIESHLEPTIRRFDRVLHQSNRYYGFLVQDSDPIELDENNEDPITYMDAL